MSDKARPTSIAIIKAFLIVFVSFSDDGSGLSKNPSLKPFPCPTLQVLQLQACATMPAVTGMRHHAQLEYGHDGSSQLSLRSSRASSSLVVKRIRRGDSMISFLLELA